MRKFSVSTPYGQLSPSYPEDLLDREQWNWFSQAFLQMATVYGVSAAKPERATLVDVHPGLSALLARYLEVCSPRTKLTHRKISVGELKLPTFNLNPEKSVIFFTSGKDSSHLLLRLQEEGYAAHGNLLAVYCTNLNRSETHYEKTSTKEICANMGIPLVHVPVVNSVKLNRTSHNIGLREQLVLFLALPYVIAHGASKVFYGLHGQVEHMADALWTADFEAFGFMNRYLESQGLAIEISKHIDFPGIDEELIIKDLCTRAPDLLRISTSCYTQANFREHHHELLAAKCPGVPIYKGCGHCLKCCRINAGLVLYDANQHEWPQRSTQVLKQHLRKRLAEKFSQDHTLSDMIAQFRSDDNGCQKEVTC